MAAAEWSKYGNAGGWQLPPKKKKDDKKNTILYPEHYNLVEEELAQLSELFEADRPKSME